MFTLLSRAKGSGGRSDDILLGQVVDPALPPDLLLLAFDACQRLLDLLETDELRQVAVWKLAGHTNEAIAAKRGCSSATVERILSQIRETWRRTWVNAVPHGPAKSGPRRGSNASAGHVASAGLSVDDMDAVAAAQVLRDLAGLT